MNTPDDIITFDVKAIIGTILKHATEENSFLAEKTCDAVKGLVARLERDGVETLTGRECFWLTTVWDAICSYMEKARAHQAANEAMAAMSALGEPTTTVITPDNMTEHPTPVLQALYAEAAKHGQQGVEVVVAVKAELEKRGAEVPGSDHTIN